MFKLLLKDYKTILNYYDIDYDKLKNTEIKNKAEEVLAQKLCKCIKKIDRKNKTNPVPLCKNSVISKKGLHIYNFSCKNKPSLRYKKNTRKKIAKTRKTLKIKI